MIKHATYLSPAEALSATDDFYRSRQGFGYDLEKVVAWLKAHVRVPARGRVLDLCCGDGIWSKGFQEINPALELYGIDISEGGIEKAKGLVGDTAGRFVVGDVECEMPFPKGHFDLIFARGPGLFNQHDMSRPACVKVIELWHEHLGPRGVFLGIFASQPRLMGTYTPMEEAALPFNRAPRKTETIDFTGGKYHHTVESFHAPFWRAETVDVVSYSFVGNMHIITTRAKRG
jgi:SAM-dependent methyltransferase